MHPPSFFSYATSRRFVPVFIAFVFVAGMIFFLLQLPAGNNKQGSSAIASPTPVPLQADEPLAQHYVAPNNTYSFSYPSSWEKISNQGDPVTTVVYKEGTTEYRFSVSPPGQINPEGVGGLSKQTQVVTYSDKKYSRTIWSSNGTPFFITAVPQTGSNTYYVLSMQIPANNTGNYVSIFDRIASTLSY